MIYSFIQRIRSFVVPKVCYFCRGLLNGGESYLCQECRHDFREAESPLCQTCGSSCDTVLTMCSSCLKQERNWDHGVTLWPYWTLVREAIIRYKYRGEIYWVKFFAHEMAEKIKAWDVQPTLITWIPLHWWKWCRRGYNQSQMLAESVAFELKIPCKRTLVRVNSTRQQARLSRKERLINVRHAFKLSRLGLEQVPMQHVLIFDDVLTTGATLNVASNVLKKNGAKAVSIISIARG